MRKCHQRTLHQEGKREDLLNIFIAKEHLMIVMMMSGKKEEEGR